MSMLKHFLFALFLVLSSSALCLELEISELVKAAKSGDAEAMYGVFFEIVKRGTVEHPVTKKDGKLATYWLMQAGEHNSVKAAYVLQTCYETGCFGVPIDKKRAQHYKELAKKTAPQ